MTAKINAAAAVSKREKELLLDVMTMAPSLEKKINYLKEKALPVEWVKWLIPEIKDNPEELNEMFYYLVSKESPDHLYQFYFKDKTEKISILDDAFTRH